MLVVVEGGVEGEQRKGRCSRLLWNGEGPAHG